jgi:hypothetical protein
VCIKDCLPTDVGCAAVLNMIAAALSEISDNVTITFNAPTNTAGAPLLQTVPCDVLRCVVVRLL